LRRRQRNPAHVPRIALGQYLDEDLLVRARAEERENGRQELVEPYIHDAAAHSDDSANVR
jgi:hypothetical protein